MVASIDGIDFYDLVSIRAELSASPGALPRILQDYGIRDAQALADVERRWMERIEADPELRRSYRLFYDHHHAQFAEQARREAERRAAAEPPAPPPVAVDRAPPPDREPPPAPLPAPAPPAPVAPLQSTAPTLDLPRGPELPFHRGAAPAVEIAAPRGAVVRRPEESLTGTARALDIPRGPAIPFASGASTARPAPAAAPVAAPPGPSPLAETSLALAIPRGPALPFAGRPAGAPGPEAPPPAAPPAPSAPGLPTGTAPTLDIPRGPAIPFAGAGSAPAALTLEQHASLHVELALWPDQAEATLTRYRITREAKARLDAELGERIARSPELREAWDKACRTYQAWLVARQGSR